MLRLFGLSSTPATRRCTRPTSCAFSSSRARNEGEIERQDADLIEAVFEFSEKNAREVMTPRTAIVAMHCRDDPR